MADMRENINEKAKLSKKMKEKMQPMVEEKNKKREAIRILFEGDEANEMIKKMRHAESDKRRAENKELYDAYKAIRQQVKEDKITFDEALEKLQTIAPDLTQEKLEELIGISQSSELSDASLDAYISNFIDENVEKMKNNDNAPLEQDIQALKSWEGFKSEKLDSGEQKVTLPMPDGTFKTIITTSKA